MRNGPLRERQVSHRDHGPLLGTLGDELEEEFGPEIGYGDVGDFIDDGQLDARQAIDHAAQLVLMLRFEGVVDERGRRCEAYQLPLPASGHPEPDSEMGLPRAGLPEEEDRFRGREIRAFRQRAERRRRDDGRL